MTQVSHAARRRPFATAAAALGLLAVVGAVIAALAIAAPAGTAAQAQYAPVNTVKPTVSDTTPETGQTLTAGNGTWTGDQPIVFSYQWLRCNPGGQNCVVIPNATSSTYTVQAADVSNTLRARVNASNASGSSSADSDQTSVVTQGAPPTGTVQIASVVAPNRLLIDSVQFSPNPIRSRNAAIQVRVRVLEVQSRRPVQGAIVFVRSTPLVTTAPPEAQTGADGWVTVQTIPERDFPQLRSGYSLQFFVRARKSGEDPLAGVSTRRLVQVGLSR